jgi:hypothetical protein
MRPSALISAAVRAAKREGLSIARVVYDPETGRVEILTPLAQPEPQTLENVEWKE